MNLSDSIKQIVFRISSVLLVISFATPIVGASEADAIYQDEGDRYVAPRDSIVWDLLHREGFEVTEHNRSQLFTAGQDKFDDLFAEIGRATDHIHMEYFNFRNDSISGLLFALLGRKAAQGVEVRILFDAFGNWSNNRPLNRSHLEAIRAQGIEIVKFDPIVFPYINHASSRDHRKVVVIDGRVGYTGGMNVADYYIEGLPKIGPWLDMHLRIEGEAVADLQDIFLDMWYRETGQRLEGERYYPPLSLQEEAWEQRISIVDRKPHATPEAIKQAYSASIAAARHEISIINPYFVPTTSIKRALHRALERGVRINIMVPERSDIPFTPDAMLYKLRQLSKRGARVLLYQGGFHHSKAMTVDATFCTVGSANLNSRSLRYDYETNAFVFDSVMTASIDSVFRRDTEHCIPLDDAYWRRRSPWRKFVGWFANLLTPFL